jgi:hypothetical protein
VPALRSCVRATSCGASCVFLAKRLAVGAACGAAWGAVAATVFAAMFRGLLPAPGEVAIPFAIGLVVLYFPFLVAGGLETLLGRSSPSFAEVVGVTVACGTALGLAASSLIALARRGHQS